jgi:glutamyl-tRNA synthetase
MDQLEKVFDDSKIQKGGAKFDFEKARWINHKFLEFTEQKAIFDRFPEFIKCLPAHWSEKKRSAVYELLRDRLFLLDDLRIESRLFLNDPEEYDSKVMNKIEKHNPEKIISQFIQFAKNSVSVREWKSEIQKWNEKEGLPFGAIMQSLRLALVGNLSGPDLFDICEVLGNEITLRRLEKFINH